MTALGYLSTFLKDLEVNGNSGKYVDFGARKNQVILNNLTDFSPDNNIDFSFRCKEVQLPDEKITFNGIHYEFFKFL